MSVARDADPIFMGSANDVAVRDENYDDGYTNKCLDISEFSVAATNRELVNLENAAVNIDNSSDVIIGPVTQFNVNGNVTIYQNKDGLPIGIEQNDDDVIPNCNGNVKAQPTSDKSQKQEQEEVAYTSRRKYTLKFYICVIIVMFLLLATTIILIVVFNTNTKNLPVGENTWINSSFGTVTLIPRKNWNGREPKKTIPMKTPVDFVVIKHTGGGICRDFTGCAKKLQTIQSTDFTDGRNDIYCSFVVGGDGNVYEGRGWDSKPEYLDNAIDIVMLGNFAIDEFTVPMINATNALLEYGIKQKKLTKNYRLVNHNQTEITLSPGQYVAREVVTWPHYDSRNYLGVPLLVSTHSKNT